MYVEPLEQTATVDSGIKRGTILIVEDDTAMAEVLSIALERQGFETQMACSGELGLSLARNGRPRVVLLDLQLPDVNGLDICQKLVDDERTSEIPVIIVSGWEHPDVVRRSRAAGCIYYVRKPYDPNALLALIEQAILESEF